MGSEMCIRDSDSTEGFAKDMTLRRMGFPEEGIQLWRQYDNTRRMRILTAYGYTDPISPEYGAWGQGAVESPIGWLAFMCWMSAYVNTKSTKSYTYTFAPERQTHTRVQAKGEWEVWKHRKKCNGCGSVCYLHAVSRGFWLLQWSGLHTHLRFSQTAFRLA